MIRKIVATSSVRVLHAASNVLMLLLATNYLGSEQWGLSGIILLDVSLILLFADMVGNSLVYYASKRNAKTLFLWSLLWLVSTILFSGLLFLLLKRIPEFSQYLLPDGFETAILAMVFLSGLQGIQLNLLLGKEKIKIFNALFLLQFVLLLLAFSVMIFILDERSAWGFVFAQMFSYAVANLFALVALLNQKLFRSVLPRATLRELLGFGTITQVSSVVHLLNKRLGYYFISKILGLGAVGVYSSGVQLAEGLRLIGQSIALVQMSAISNRDDKEFAKQLTLQLLKLSFVLTLGGVLILNIIPASWYGMIFGRDFQEIKTIVLCLSPGVLALAANAVFSHFFSGSGIPTYNLKASFTGFVISVLALLFLIPYFGMNGAAISASLAYIAAIIYQWFVFRKLTNSSLQDLLISSKDIRTILASLKHFMRQQQ